MSALNVPFDLANAEELIIPLDRWSEPKYTVQLDSGTTIAVHGTNAQINRGDTPAWATMAGRTSASPELAILLAAVGPGYAIMENNPVEAIRITATGACVGRVMQSGASSR